MDWELRAALSIDVGRLILGHQRIEELVVIFSGNFVHDLAGEAEAHSKRFGAEPRERAVVVAAPLAEPSALSVEGDARYDDHVEHRRIDCSTLRLHHSHVAGVEISEGRGGGELEQLADDAREQHRGISFEQQE